MRFAQGEEIKKDYNFESIGISKVKFIKINVTCYIIRDSTKLCTAI